MVTVKRIVLDVLKPHQPDALAFSRELAVSGSGWIFRRYLVVNGFDGALTMPGWY